MSIATFISFSSNVWNNGSELVPVACYRYICGKPYSIHFITIIAIIMRNAIRYISELLCPSLLNPIARIDVPFKNAIYPKPKPNNGFVSASDSNTFLAFINLLLKRCPIPNSTRSSDIIDKYYEHSMIKLLTTTSEITHLLSPVL